MGIFLNGVVTTVDVETIGEACPASRIAAGGGGGRTTILARGGVECSRMSR